MKKIIEKLRDPKRLVGLSVLCVVCILATILVVGIENGNNKSIGVPNKKIEAAEGGENSNLLVTSSLSSSLSLEVLSCEMIEDFDIESQTAYAPEWFSSGKLPDGDYQEEYVDYTKIKEACPDLKEFWEGSDYSEARSRELQEKNRSIIEQYTTHKHPKTRYYFVKCRITNLYEGESNLSLPYEVFVSSDRGEYLDVHDSYMTYFDKAVNTVGDDREHSFFWYPFEEGEVLECTLGFEVKQEYQDDDMNEKYYLGVRAPWEDYYTLENTKLLFLGAAGDANE